jgi:uncharacterized membrane protein
MYYDDEGRTFNLATGLLFGTLLGAGLALLVTPQKRLPDTRRVRRTARRIRSGAEGTLETLGGRLMEAVAAGINEAWKGAR